MVDFRYHLVSIIAVFLALAVGIVVGTTALNGPVLDGLKTSVSALTGDKRALEADVRTLRRQASGADDFTRLTAPVLLRSTLLGQRVLLLSTPDAPGGLRDNLQAALLAAGAVVTADVRLRPRLLDPAASATVRDVVQAVLPADLALPEGKPTDKAAAEIAAALVSSPQRLSSSAAQKVVGGFAGADLLDLASGSVDGSASLVLVLSGPSPAKPDATVDAGNAVLLGVAKAFDARSGVVVVGPTTSADGKGLIAALRASGLDGRVSTVDDGDDPQGVVASVLALAEQVDGGGGSYGTGRGASATAPVPAAAR